MERSFREVPSLISSGSDLKSLEFSTGRWMLPVIAVGAVVAMRGLGNLREAVIPYLFLHSIGSLAWGAWCALILRTPTQAFSPTRVVVLLLLGALARLSLLGAPPDLSDDAWRYLWEGRVSAAGFNPLALAPDSPELTFLRDENWEKVTHREVSGIYPPAAQAVFRGVVGVAPSSSGFQGMALLAEGGMVLILLLLLSHRGIPLERVGMYWLCPLSAVEVARNAHLEPLALLGMMAAVLALSRGRSLAAGGFLVLAAGVKVFPGLLLPLAGREWKGWRRWGAGVLTVSLALSVPAWPYLGDGVEALSGALTYGKHWEFNGFLFPALRPWLGGGGARLVLGVIFVSLLAKCFGRGESPSQVGAQAGLAFLLLSPTVHPWYGLWALAFSPLHPHPAVLWLGGTLPLSYLVLHGYSAADPASWSLPLWVPVVEYGLVLVLLLRSALQRRSMESRKGSTVR